jgi:hypothetical protein
MIDTLIVASSTTSSTAFDLLAKNTYSISGLVPCHYLCSCLHIYTPIINKMYIGAWQIRPFPNLAEGRNQTENMMECSCHMIHPHMRNTQHFV